jgi:hypothetical protein
MNRFANGLCVSPPPDEPGPHLTNHMFRKRPFTLAWEAGIDMRQASIAFGCNVDTLMKHYLAMNEEDVTHSVFAGLHSNNRQINGRRLKPKNRLEPPSSPLIFAGLPTLSEGEPTVLNGVVLGQWVG